VGGVGCGVGCGAADWRSATVGGGAGPKDYPHLFYVV